MGVFMIIENENGLQKITNIIAINNWTNDCDGVFDRFMTYCFNKPRPFNDTFNILNKYQTINYQNLSNTLPSDLFDTPCFDNFAQLTDKRIVQLCNSHEHLTVLWSGGCDSSVIVAGLIRNHIDKAKYRIVCTASAVEESPRMYQWLVDNKYPIHYIGDASLYQFLNQDQDQLYINGCPEQIFRYPVTTTGFRDYYFTHWKTGIAKINDVKNIGLTEQQCNNIIDIFEEFLYTLNIPITYTIDLMWLVVFSGMWTYAGTMFPANLDLQAKYSSSFVEFFKTDDFARWAVTNSLYHYPVQDWYQNAINYRTEEKKYIASVFNDDEIKYKTKKYSQRVEDNKRPNEMISIFHDDHQIVRISREYKQLIKYIVAK